jgi:hypothetical protein
MTLEELKAQYAPYHTMPQFARGFADYQAGHPDYQYAGDVDQQAYDRGAECAMRWERMRFPHTVAGDRKYLGR